MSRPVLVLLLVFSLLLHGCQWTGSKKSYTKQSLAAAWLEEHPVADATLGSMALVLVGLGLLAAIIAYWYLNNQSNDDGPPQHNPYASERIPADAFER